MAIPLLSFGGTDPTGGAGLQADSEAMRYFGTHCCPIVTAVTAQDTHDLHTLYPLPAELVAAQAKAVLSDIAIAAIKISLVPNAEIAVVIADIIRDYPNLPVVLDPVLSTGAGSVLAAQPDAIAEHLLPLATLTTPNQREVFALAGMSPGEAALDECAQVLLDKGSQHVLMTGTDSETEKASSDLVTHFHYYLEDGALKKETVSAKRLPQQYHGSGCTFAASLTALLAQGQSVSEGINIAQEYTWETLSQAYQLGKGQWLPNRMIQE